MFRYLLILLLPVVLLLFLLQCTATSPLPSGKVTTLYKEQLAEWKDACLWLQKTVEQHKASEQQQAAYQKARTAYKKIEAFVEYFHPGTAKAINGPNVPDVEADAPEKVVEPTGFQVLEECLYPEADATRSEDALAQAKALVSLARRLQNGTTGPTFTDAHIWDALRLQLFRIQTIGISGGDSPIALASMPEAATAVEAVAQYLYNYPQAESNNELKKSFQQCIALLQQAKSFDDFDRAAFIRASMNPLCRTLHAVQKICGIPFFTEARPLRADAATLFDDGAFNPAYYSADPMALYDSVLVEIGRRLFIDKRLSGNNTRSCASCHNPDKQFTDGLAQSTTFDGKHRILRNTPALPYAGLQPVQFADSRTAYLEDQARAVIENHAEMHGNMDEVCKKLSNDKVYQQLLQQRFATTQMTPGYLQKALGAYTRSLPLFRSRFDAFMKGDANALDKEEQKGFNLFMGKAKCGTCHFMPLFNGVVPPAFTRMESEVLGVPLQAKPPYTLDTDEGKHSYTLSPVHLYSFKTPTVRNSAATAPYMHNGVFSSLEEVMDFYNRGGGIGLGLIVENQTLPATKLDLTAEEQQALIKFLTALSDEKK